MNISYSTGYWSLWTAFAASATIAILNDFSWPTLWFAAIVIAALGYWIASRRKELRATYESAEAAAAVPGPYDKLIWGHKPALRDFAPLFVIVGIGILYLAYEAAHGDPQTTRIATFVFRFAGVPGVVALWTIVGSSILATATEILIGSHVRK